MPGKGKALAKQSKQKPIDNPAPGKAELFPGLGWMADLDAWLEQYDVVGVAHGDVVLVGLPKDVEALLEGRANDE